MLPRPESPPALTELSPARLNIVDWTRRSGAFTVLLRGIDRAGLDRALSDDGPFTFFAPSDAAFAQWPRGAVDWLLAEPELLTEILTYHVLRTQITADELRSLCRARTLQGEELYVSAHDGVRVDGARLLMTDLRASNGLVHVVDRVLIPARI